MKTKSTANQPFIEFSDIRQPGDSLTVKIVPALATPEAVNTLHDAIIPAIHHAFATPLVKGVTLDQFEHLRPIGDEEAGLLGTLYVLGTPYHFQFVEVEEDRDGTWRPIKDPYKRLDDAERLYEAPLLATKIDGKLYIGFAHPHGD